MLTFSGFDSCTSMEVIRDAIALGNKAEVNRRMFLMAKSCDRMDS